MNVERAGPPGKEKARNASPSARANPKITFTSANNHHTQDSAPARHISAQSTSWWDVHTFVEPLLAEVGSWPMVGTPEWCSLAEDDPRKWAALLDAAQHFALRVETCQVAECEASHEISAAADWGQVGREIRQRNEFFAAKPWLRRAAS